MADMIDKLETIEHIKKRLEETALNNVGFNEDVYLDIADHRIETWVNEVPSAQPEQKVGKWIRHENEDGEPYGHNCSVCGEWYVMPYGKTKFCPNCGAKMEE